MTIGNRDQSIENRFFFFKLHFLKYCVHIQNTDSPKSIKKSNLVTNLIVLMQYIKKYIHKNAHIGEIGLVAFEKLPLRLKDHREIHIRIYSCDNKTHIFHYSYTIVLFTSLVQCTICSAPQWYKVYKLLPYSKRIN